MAPHLRIDLSTMLPPSPPAGAPALAGRHRPPLLRRRRRDVGPLRRAAAFAHADPATLAELAPRADVLHLPRGLPLAEAGATARELVVLLSGEAALVGPDGARMPLLPGAEVGGREVLAGARHAATVVTTTAVEVLVVDGPAVRWAAAEGALHLATPSSTSLTRAPSAASRPDTPVVPTSPATDDALVSAPC